MFKPLLAQGKSYKVHFAHEEDTNRRSNTLLSHQDVQATESSVTQFEEGKNLKG